MWRAKFCFLLKFKRLWLEVGRLNLLWFYGESVLNLPS
ncbi:hypothetical protein CSUNSWCD_2209 [Campylobacter showae CSUNSWCD]|uniref:Uncharacterized protein n=1 Tax=Campylobacter showae CSUNSWCD TaxID=1244083 RepID=M5IQ93_9BACT|nr:hypothetical protein CSUNSWCD_2209 [Campylobacter showae CSUNSWCD]